jgi:hypothetical protein
LSLAPKEKVVIEYVNNKFSKKIENEKEMKEKASAFLEVINEKYLDFFPKKQINPEEVIKFELRLTQLTDYIKHFYETNNHLDKREYALKAKQEESKDLTSILMLNYSGESIDMKKFIIKSWNNYFKEVKATNSERNELINNFYKNKNEIKKIPNQSDWRFLIN